MTCSSDIYLRAIEPDDIDLLYEVENDCSLWRYGDTTVPYSRESLRQYLLECSNDIYRDRQVRLVIERRADDAGGGAGRADGAGCTDGAGSSVSVGFADLFNFDPKHLRAEVGVVVMPAHQGCGYAARALFILEQLAAQWHLHQISATIGVHNAPALQLFRNAGYVESAALRDWLLLSDGQYADAVVFQKLLA